MYLFREWRIALPPKGTTTSHHGGSWTLGVIMSHFQGWFSVCGARSLTIHSVERSGVGSSNYTRHILETGSSYCCRRCIVRDTTKELPAVTHPSSGVNVAGLFNFHPNSKNSATSIVRRTFIAPVLERSSLFS